ncbi:MAG: DUF58 domain-containing protein [Planctomycetia bacterium]
MNGERPVLTSELMARVRAIEIRTHKLVNTALSGGYRSSFRGQGIEFQEVRAYQPGDDVRRIEWNVTARTGEAFVKNYAEERELTVQLIVDSSRSMDLGSAEWTKREIAAQFAALIAFVGLRHGDRVGLTLFGEQPGLHLPPRKGSQHVLRIVREVLAARPTALGSRLGAALEREERLLRRRSVVLVVSDFLSDSHAQSDWSATLTRLALRHDCIAVRVRDPLESELPPAGVLPLQALEGTARVEADTRRASVRAAWRAAFDAREVTLRANLSRAQAELVDLDTTQDVGESVRAFFRRRTHVRGGSR